jgi:integrase
MVRKTRRLSAVAVRNAKPGLHPDGGNLYLQVADSGAKSWLFRFGRGGRERWMGLGPLITVSLAEAREKALECRKVLLAGDDPIEARKAARGQQMLDAAKTVTFRKCAEGFQSAHGAGWRSKRHSAQWDQTLAAYVFPVFGGLPVSAIDTSLVMKALEPIWTTMPETASRVRGRIERILDWAKVRGHRQGENPARWRGHLDHLLPARSKVARVNHLAALAYSEVPSFLTELRARDGIAARALEFTILTAARTSEVLGARWSEFDGNIWVVPGERMKAGREHRVPLSNRAIEILERLPRDGEFVFIGAQRGSALNVAAMLRALKRMGREDLTVHGFRSSFRDWAAETTSYPNHVVEMALAHAIGDAVEAAYRRGDLFEKRRRLMDAWGQFCATARDSAKVLPIGTSKK